MGFVVSGLVVVYLLCIADLLLTFGVIRRLRQYADEFAKLASIQGGQLGPPKSPTVAVGSVPGDFATTTTAGEPLSRAHLQTGDGRTIVAFFSPSCSSCAEQLSEFVRRVPALLVGADRAVAVVVGDASEVSAMVAELAPVARVVVEPWNGPVGAAFGLGGVPAFGLLDSAGVVLATAYAFDRLTAPATV
jgi:hypothetical protein